MIKTLSELCSPDRSICYGIVQPGRPTDAGKPILRVKDLSGNRINISEAMRVEEAIEAKYKRSRVRTGDVLVSLVGSMGQVAIAGTDVDGWNIARAIGLVPVVDRHHAEWVRYSIQSREAQQFIQDHANTTVQATFNLKDLARLPIPYPARETRNEVLGILGALDDKIEVNRKMAATLEEMARALYRSWFVDFDPVHAKAAGSRPAHMDTQTAALFPDSFGEDGMPEGWEWGILSDLIDFNPKEKLPKGTLAPYLDMKALPTAGMSADTPYDRAFTSGTKFRARDTLLARITPCLENGKTAMVDDIGDAEVGWGSTEFIVMRAKEGVPLSLPYCVARDTSFREDAIASMTGSSGRQRADAKTIAAIEAAVPVEEILVAFGAATMPMVEKIHQLGSENQTLATLRDTLLPRLMSGELRVGEAKEQVEAVA